MIISYCLIYLLAFFIPKVTLGDMVTVKQSTGDYAVLPCSYTGDKRKVDTVHWRYNDKNPVYEFSPSNSDDVKHDTRAESFPEEYVNGNYSIKIRKLQLTDAGLYTCFITPADYHVTVNLTIKERPITGQRNQGTKTRPEIAILFIFFCAFYLY